MRRRTEADMVSDVLNKDDGSIADAVFAVVESMPDGTFFFGNELQTAAARICPRAKNVYISSVLTSLRRRCGDMVRCVDKNDSLYQKIGYQRTVA